MFAELVREEETTEEVLDDMLEELVEGVPQLLS